MFEERKEQNPSAHTHLSLIPSSCSCWSASGSSPSLGAGLPGLSARSLPLSLYRLSSHVLICSDSPDGNPRSLTCSSSPMWSEKITYHFVPWLLSVTLCVCVCVWGWKRLAGGTLCVLVSAFPATAPGKNMFSTWWPEVWWPETEECGTGGSYEMIVIPGVCWALTVRQALGSVLDSCLSQSSAKLSDVQMLLSIILVKKWRV